MPARWWLLGAALLAVGCGEEPRVVRYRVPREAAPSAAAAGPARTLGAIVPRSDRTWFFKLTGAPDEIEPHKPAFLELVRSLKFGAGGPEWTLPAGWQAREGSGMRFATLMPEPGLELSVTSLDQAGGGLLANINRWREQVGLEPLEESELAARTETIALEGAQAVVVDLVGGGAAGAPKMGVDTFVRGLRELMRFDLPAGWTPNPSPESGRIFEFAAGTSALVTVNAFAGMTGGLAANVNRWRAQVGLDPLDDADAEALARPVLILTAEGRMVEVVGERDAIVTAFILREELSLFFKLSGPSVAVADQKPAFEAFLRSLRIEQP
jgi:hypothetical protein